MTDMPQLVAAFHRLVGLAAVLVGWAAYLNPEAFGIAGARTAMINAGQPDRDGRLASPSVRSPSPARSSPSSSSHGKMRGAPIMLPGRHVINLGTLVAIIGLIGYFTHATSALWVIAAITALSFLIGFLLIIPIGGADMPVVVSMLNSLFGLGGGGDGLHAAQHRDDHHRRAGRLVGRDPVSYIMCKAMNRSFISVIAGGFGAEAACGGGEAKEQRPWKRGSAEDAAFLLKEAETGHHHPRLRHGGGAGAARAARNGRPAEGEGRRGQIRDPPGRGPHAGAHERAAGRSQRAL